MNAKRPPDRERVRSGGGGSRQGEAGELDEEVEMIQGLSLGALCGIAIGVPLRIWILRRWPKA